MSYYFGAGGIISFGVDYFASLRIWPGEGEGDEENKDPEFSRPFPPPLTKNKRLPKIKAVSRATK